MKVQGGKKSKGTKRKAQQLSHGLTVSLLFKLGASLGVFKTPLQWQDFPGGSDGKASAYNAGDPGLIPGLGRSSGEGNGNPFQYSCMENPMDGGVWCATDHGVAKSWTGLSDFTFTFFLQWHKEPVNYQVMLFGTDLGMI